MGGAGGGRGFAMDGTVVMMGQGLRTARLRRRSWSWANSWLPLPRCRPLRAPLFRGRRQTATANALRALRPALLGLWRRLIGSTRSLPCQLSNRGGEGTRAVRRSGSGHGQGDGRPLPVPGWPRQAILLSCRGRFAAEHPDGVSGAALWAGPGFVLGAFHVVVAHLSFHDPGCRP